MNIGGRAEKSVRGGQHNEIRLPNALMNSSWIEAPQDSIRSLDSLPQARANSHLPHFFPVSIPLNLHIEAVVRLVVIILPKILQDIPNLPSRPDSDRVEAIKLGIIPVHLR